MAYKFQLGAAKLGGAITSTGVISGSALSASSPVAIGEGGTGQSTAAGAASALLNVSQGGALTIGDSSDTITIPGSLTINGGTTNVSTTNLVVEDANILIANGGAPADGNGLTIGTDGTPVVFALSDSAARLSSSLPLKASLFDGNASTATKLATARTIAGVSFDGSANISLNNNAITNGAGYITSAGNAATATALASAVEIGGVSFDGQSDIDPKDLDLTALTAASAHNLLIAAGATGVQTVGTDAQLTYNPSTNTLGTSTVKYVGDGQSLTNITSDKAKSLRLSGSTAVLEGNHDAGSQDVMLCDSSAITGSANLTITMPTISTDTVGRVYIIKDVTGAASASGKHIVVVSGSNTGGPVLNGEIDGQNSITIQSAFGAVNLLACSGSGIGFFYSIF